MAIRMLIETGFVIFKDIKRDEEDSKPVLRMGEIVDKVRIADDWYSNTTVRSTSGVAITNFDAFLIKEQGTGDFFIVHPKNLIREASENDIQKFKMVGG